MSFPLRNMVRNTKAHSISFKGIDLVKHFSSKQELLLPGYSYEIRDSCFKWGEVTCGKYIYELKFTKRNIFTDVNNKDKNKILLINKYEDLVKFKKEYLKFKMTSIKGIKEDNTKDINIRIGYLKTIKLMKDYGGIEIRNYNTLRKKLLEDEKDKYQSTFFYVLDYDCGKFWNEKIIKEIKYFREVKKSDYK